MKSKCIFCGGLSRQTKEHAIPQWCANLKPANVRVRMEGEHLNIRKWDILTDKVEIKVGGICVECNSGWMSRLESEVKPLLLPLLEGKEVQLSVMTQRVIATWAIKTVMVLEFSSASSRPKYFSQKEREALCSHQIIPGSTAVFLAGYQGQHPFRGSEHPVEFYDGKQHFTGYSSTTVFRFLVVQVFSYRAEGGQRLFRVADFPQAEIQVWPAKEQVIWPPQEIFDDGGIEMYTKRWNFTNGKT